MIRNFFLSEIKFSKKNILATFKINLNLKVFWSINNYTVEKKKNELVNELFVLIIKNKKEGHNILTSGIYCSNTRNNILLNKIKQMK